MNKSVLPIALDTLSLSKPVKKPWVDLDVSASDRRDIFAEHLSQSQRELKKDKHADVAENKSRGKTDEPKTRVATENSHHKKPVKKEAADHQQEPVSRLDASIKTEKENLKPTSHNADASAQEVSAETIVDSVGEMTTEPALVVNPISEADLALTQTTSVESASIVTETAAEIMPEAEYLTENFAQIQLDSEKDLSLAETNPELINKGVDIKEFGENYLQGIDIRQQQKPLVADVVEPAEIANDLTALSEIMAAADKTAETNDPANVSINTPINIPGIENKLTQNHSPAAIPANKNGVELPLELTVVDSEVTSDPGLDEFINLTDEVKSEDKSTKTDLFKTLLGQSQTEKTSLVVEKPAVAAPLVTALAATQVATANRLFVPQTQLGMNAAHPHWGNAVGEKIMWMANQQLSSADIRLDPPELGSLQVKVTVQQDQANITFITPHPQVRELLDQQVTRLREMFAEQGLNLGQVDIADKREHESRQSDDESKSKSRFVSEESEETRVAPVSSLYLVDQFV